jgi:uncharacterized protein (DUF342 family)
MKFKEMSNDEFFDYINSLENLSLENDVSIKRVKIECYDIYISWGNKFSEPRVNCKTIEFYSKVKIYIYKNLNENRKDFSDDLYKLVEDIIPSSHYKYWIRFVLDDWFLNPSDIKIMFKDIDTLLLVGAFV